MLKPETLKAEPADSYGDLKRQFFALKYLCESKIKQCSLYSKKLAEYDRESVIARNEAIESEREMNAQLTEELEKANERIAELEEAVATAIDTFNKYEMDIDTYPTIEHVKMKNGLHECLNKFAVEKKIEGIEEAINNAPSKEKYSLPLVDITDLYDYAEQLRKE